MEIEECLEGMLANICAGCQTKKVHILDAEGKISAEDIFAPMMVPPFPKSAMDGYAVRSEDVAGASKETPVVLTVVEEMFAGDYKEIEAKAGTTVRIMTGALVPEGYDAVIRQEDTDYGEKEVKIYTSIKPYDNYCQVGEDIKKGQLVLAKGTRLTPLTIGLLASLGINEIEIRKPVRTAIISTGSELMSPEDMLKPGKIYASIGYILKTAIEKEGLEVSRMTLCADDEDELAGLITEASKEADIIITTGGVSVGKRDIVPAVLEGLGAKSIFTRANIQPGTPTKGSILFGKPVISLSGNPYAALANFELYFWPIVARIMDNSSFEPIRKKVVLMSEYTKVNKHRRLVRANACDGKVYLPTAQHASSVIYNLTECNCFIDMPAGSSVKPGDEVDVVFFK